MGPVLAASPWFVEAFDRFLGALRRWWIEQSAPEVVAQASFLLIVGGLLMLAVVVGTALLRSLIPFGGATPQPVRERSARRMLRTASLPISPAVVERGRADSRPSVDGYEAGRRLAQKWRPASVDDALGVVAKEAVAEPRLLRVFADGASIRHYGCRGCEGARRGEEGCSRPIGFYEASFERIFARKARAIERACHRRGDAACEFEVRW